LAGGPVTLSDKVTASKQPPSSHTQVDPYLDYAIHDNGYLFTTIWNNGLIGNLFGAEYHDLGKTAPAFYHPRYSRIQHGYYSGLWVGGIVGRDTLVSVSMDVAWDPWHRGYPIEFWPDEYPFGQITHSSSDPTSPNFDTDAKAEQQFTATFTDTFERESFVPSNSYDHRSHKPLNIEVKQTSYSWSQKYARDFIIVDYFVTNVGRYPIRDAYIGIYYVGCVRHRGEQPYPPSDDLCSFLAEAWPEYRQCGLEPINAALIRDNDGWAYSFEWNLERTSSAFAIAPVMLPSEDAIVNFNWWTNAYSTGYNWGPRQRGTYEWPFRRFSDFGLGDPLSDKDKYYLMARPEQDYPGHEAAVNHSREGWLPPHSEGPTIAEGHLPEMVISTGPVDIPPGGGARFAVVYAVGEDLHWNRLAYRDLWNPSQPVEFARQLDYSDLLENIRWAKRVWDNPGTDSNFDGDSGVYIWHVDPETGDSTQVFCSGDGVPDIKGASPPPAPPVRVVVSDGRIAIRWDGREAENYFDLFSGIRDFEGYRVWYSRSPRLEEMSLLASWDRENYNRYSYDFQAGMWRLREIPLSIDSLRTLYGDHFEPLNYPRTNPFRIGGSMFYFEPVGDNMSDIRDTDRIHKVYPEATPDTSDVDEEGRMRYYQYEYILEDLLPSVPYWVSVSAFDFGNPAKDLEPMESIPTVNAVEAFARDTEPEVLKNGQLDVHCYPNPYRADALYEGRGFENRVGDLWSERAHRIWFGNLPDRCTISIYTLDGDLVERIEHHEPATSGTASVASWDLINRNSEMVMSGLYYWTVESAYGTQIGKLVIIK
jgi:hypothetical protein